MTGIGRTLVAGYVLASALEVLAVPALAQTYSRVQGESRLAAALLKDGAARSVTIRTLLAALEQSDVVVVVRAQMHPEGEQGHTTIITATEKSRYLSVFVNLRLAPSRRLEILGHELQHTVEIALASHVRDADALRAHMRTIGRQSVAGNTFETDAAHDIELRVRREIRL